MSNTSASTGQCPESKLRAEAEARVEDPSTQNDEALPTAEEAQNELLNSITPNSREEAPSAKYFERLKNLLIKYTDEKWPEVETAVAEFIEAARVHVKIDDFSPVPSGRNEVNLNDPTATQRLYRRLCGGISFTAGKGYNAVYPL